VLQLQYLEIHPPIPLPLTKEEGRNTEKEIDKIPLNLPLKKGEFNISPFVKGG
jgi:hypothetical protein